MSRALAGRPALRQITIPARPLRRHRFLSQTAASWRDEEPPGASPFKINPLTTVFRPGAPPQGKKKDARDELHGSSWHNPSPYDSAIADSSTEGSPVGYSKIAGTMYASSETADYNFSKSDKAQSTSENRDTAGSPYGLDPNLSKPDKTQSRFEWTKNLNSSLYGQPQSTMAAKDAQATNELNKRIHEGLFGTRQTATGRAGRSDPARSEAFDSLRRSTPVDTNVLDNPQQQSFDEPPPSLEPHHLHVYAHKHNCHITFTRPNRDPIISLSCGNIGFLKANRGLFDSAYSLAKYVFERLMQKNLKINGLELVLRGYGEGRQAMLKLLMSPDGAFFRHKIIRISDSTRLKFGGCRSPGPRRI